MPITTKLKSKTLLTDWNLILELVQSRRFEYTYDSLNRLTVASSSNAATGQNYRHAFTYDAIGNILSGPAGTYAYNENTAANYANPHAVTSITNGSTTTFTYDANGNLASTTVGTSTLNSYTWDYMNRLLVVVASSSASSSYAYDHTGQRIKVVNGTSTTYYPATTYNIQGTTKTKHIFAGGLLVATVTSIGSSTTATYIHPDNLGGSSVITNGGGTVAETMDYYPYGSLRLDEQSGANEQRKYIGQEYDAATQLSYLNARYYNSAQGQFISQDPVFLGIANKQNLADPQSLNSYAYANDNPINRKDPSGNFSIAAALQALNSILTALQSIVTSLQSLSISGGSGSTGAQTTGRTGSGGSSNSVGPGISSPQATLAQPTINTYNDKFAGIEEKIARDKKSYKDGGNGPDSFDCSGAVIYGINQLVPSFTTDLSAGNLYSNYVIPGEGGRGTLNFYDYYSNGSIDHVTTNLGNGNVVNPYDENHGVVISPADAVNRYTYQKNGVVYSNYQIDWQKITQSSMR